MTQQDKAKICLLMTVLLWGTSFVAIRQSMQYFSPQNLALLRYIIGSIAILPIYFLLSKRTKPSKKDYLWLFFLGISGIGLYNIFLNLGETTTSAAIASFVISQGPVATILLAVIFLHERLTKSSWLGGLISLFGIILITYGETKALGHFNHGILYLLAAIVCTSIYSIAQKPLFKRFSPLEITAWSIWFGTLSLSYYIPSLWQQAQFQPLVHYFWPAFLGIGSGVIGYACLSYGLKHYPASKATSFLFAMPFVSTIVGWILLDEVPTFLSLLGGLLAIFGAFLIRVLPTRQK